MKLFNISKDGGPESNVTAFWLVEIKSLFSIALLRFSNGSREAYHSHAFNCISWILKGRLVENHLGQTEPDVYTPSLRPVVTRRDTFHKVVSEGTTWVLTFRGPWSKTWKEFNPASGEFSRLSSGRVVEEVWGAQ